ncbi:metal ABC transporter permease [Fervidicoccus fontis]|nr:metal ABC transporter permease [Fervidicoccus fontis]
MKIEDIYLSMLGLSIPLAIILSISYPSYFNPIWMTVLLGSALIYGIIGPILSAKNLLFLAGSIPHSALLSASMGILLSMMISGSNLVWSIIFNVILIFTIGLVIHRGSDPNKYTSIFIGTTASLTVIVLYYITNHFYLLTSVESILLGDPLLSTRSDAILIFVLAAITLLFFGLTYKEHIYIGITGEEAKLAGLRTEIYEFFFYLFLGITSATLMKIVGFILTHVFILIPGAAGSLVARKSKEAIALSMNIAAYSAIIGLFLGVFFNLSPSGTTGICMIAIYIVINVAKKVYGR